MRTLTFERDEVTIYVDIPSEYDEIPEDELTGRFDCEIEYPCEEYLITEAWGSRSADKVTSYCYEYGTCYIENGELISY